MGKKKKTKTKQPSHKYDWDKIIGLYETGRYSIKDLAKKFGDYSSKTEFNTAYAYFRRRLKDVEFDKKKKEKITKSIQDKVFDAMSTSEAKIKFEYGKYFKYLKRKIAKETLKEKPDYNKIRTLEKAIKALQICRSEEFEVYEIQEVAKKIENTVEFSDVDGVNINID